MSDLLVITGLSGAGRSEFAKDLEDLGWFVIDRLPPEISSKVADLALGGEPSAVFAGLVLDELAPGRFRGQG